VSLDKLDDGDDNITYFGSIDTCCVSLIVLRVEFDRSLNRFLVGLCGLEVQRDFRNLNRVKDSFCICRFDM
jgi:hypothetical protein